MVATSGMSIGHTGMLYATKALFMTMIDLFQSLEFIERVTAEFVERKGDYEYIGIIPSRPPPLDFEQ